MNKLALILLLIPFLSVTVSATDKGDSAKPICSANAIAQMKNKNFDCAQVNSLCGTDVTCDESKKQFIVNYLDVLKPKKMKLNTYLKLLSDVGCKDLISVERLEKHGGSTIVSSNCVTGSFCANEDAIEVHGQKICGFEKQSGVNYDQYSLKTKGTCTFQTLREMTKKNIECPMGKVMCENYKCDDSAFQVVAYRHDDPQYSKKRSWKSYLSEIQKMGCKTIMVERAYPSPKTFLSTNCQSGKDYCSKIDKTIDGTPYCIVSENYINEKQSKKSPQNSKPVTPVEGGVL